MTTWLVWILWNIRHEMQHFVVARQKWLIDPRNAQSAQASTVLITGIPQRYLTEAALIDLFSVLPGGVRKVWLNRLVQLSCVVVKCSPNHPGT